MLQIQNAEVFQHSTFKTGIRKTSNTYSTYIHERIYPVAIPILIYFCKKVLKHFPHKVTQAPNPESRSIKPSIGRRPFMEDRHIANALSHAPSNLSTVELILLLNKVTIFVINHVSIAWVVLVWCSRFL